MIGNTHWAPLRTKRLTGCLLECRPLGTSSNRWSTGCLLGLVYSKRLTLGPPSGLPLTRTLCMFRLNLGVISYQSAWVPVLPWTLANNCKISGGLFETATYIDHAGISSPLGRPLQSCGVDSRSTMPGISSQIGRLLQSCGAAMCRPDQLKPLGTRS